MIITDKGGLPETVTNAKILKKLSVKNLENTISNLIKNNKLRKSLQTLSLKNFYLTHEFITKKIDNFRSEKFQNINFFNKKKNLENLRIYILQILMKD